MGVSRSGLGVAGVEPCGARRATRLGRSGSRLQTSRPAESLLAGGLLLPTALQTTAVTVHLQDVDVVGQPVQQGACPPLGAQHLGPFGERQIAGHQSFSSRTSISSCTSDAAVVKRTRKYRIAK